MIIFISITRQRRDSISMKRYDGSLFQIYIFSLSLCLSLSLPLFCLSLSLPLSSIKCYRKTLCNRILVFKSPLRSLMSFFVQSCFSCKFRSEFLLRGVSIYILVFVNLFIYLLIYLGVPWGSSFLLQLHVDGMQLYQQ